MIRRYTGRWRRGSRRRGLMAEIQHYKPEINQGYCILAEAVKTSYRMAAMASGPGNPEDPAPIA